MYTNRTFRMPVDDVFSIRNRGTVVTGRVESGTIKIGDAVSIQRPGYSKNTTVTGIEAFRKLLKEATVGDHVGLLLANVNKEDVQQGDLLVG